jgi:hypothetical protein
MKKREVTAKRFKPNGEINILTRFLRNRANSAGAGGVSERTKIPAEVYGKWAVHLGSGFRATFFGECYMITHIATGLAAKSMASIDKAREMARALDQAGIPEFTSTKSRQYKKAEPMIKAILRPEAA